MSTRKLQPIQICFITGDSVATQAQKGPYLPSLVNRNCHLAKELENTASWACPSVPAGNLRGSTLDTPPKRCLSVFENGLELRSEAAGEPAGREQKLPKGLRRVCSMRAFNANAALSVGRSHKK